MVRALNPAGAHADESREAAEAAYRLVGLDVHRARDRATQILATVDDPGARSIAYRARALAAVELGDAEECAAFMARALTEARRSADELLVARALMGVAVGHQYLGHAAQAIRAARAAVRLAPGDARLQLSLGVVLERFGRSRESLEAYARAELLGRQAADADTLVRVWCNRGVLSIYLGDLESAGRDLEAADALWRAEGLDTLSLGITANLAFLATRRGDLVAALAGHEVVAQMVRPYGGLRLGTLELDRSETLSLAGLHVPAMRAAMAAVDAFKAAGMRTEAAEADVRTAQAALTAAQPETAHAAARSAIRVLRPAGAGAWLALAEEIQVRADWAMGHRGPALARRAAAVAGALDAAGWKTSAASARVLAARIELERGRRGPAAQQLELVRDTPRSPVGLRIQARAATALLRREAGDRRRARAALRSAWELLERHRSTLGATELRAGATAHVAEIVDIALEMAIEDRRPRDVLQWAERGRVGALTPRATAPPEDDELARLLGELRVVAAEADAAAKRGEDSRTLLRRQAQLEERVRGRARLLPPDDAGPAAPAVDPAAILRALGDRALIEYVVSGEDLWAVVGAAGRTTLRRLCTSDQVADEADGLRVALRRLAFGSPVPQLRDAAREGAGYARDRLRNLLFDPISDLIGDRERVIVPMGALHAVPWAALHEPSERWVVAPSAALWSRASAGPPPGGGTLLVAGPRLAEAGAEVEAIAAVTAGAKAGRSPHLETSVAGGEDLAAASNAHTARTHDAQPTVLTGEAATVDAVRAAMPGVGLAHFACHGRFRADNPLFSSLELHDGDLSVFELERLGRAPDRIILSACDAGLSAVHPGDELLGLAAALLRLGTTGIVASVLPVPDAATRRLMEALHAELAVPGTGLAAALARARATLDPERDDDLVASCAFQVLGAG